MDARNPRISSIDSPVKRLIAPIASNKILAQVSPGAIAGAVGQCRGWMDADGLGATGEEEALPECLQWKEHVSAQSMDGSGGEGRGMLG